MRLLTEYSLWFASFCLLLGALYTFLLYYRTDRGSVVPWLLWCMAACRFLAVAVISFLILSPLVRHRFTILEKPVIILGMDNSRSLVLTRDSAGMKGEILTNIKELAQALNTGYEVKTYSFGEAINTPMRSDFSENITDISRFFTEVSSRHLNRNIGAFIVASDGIYNRGTDPLYSLKDFPFPVYTIALGDTSSYQDLVIADVIYNRQVFPGDKFPVIVKVNATGYNNHMAHLVIKEKGKAIYETDFLITGNRYSVEITLNLEVKELGWHRFGIELSPFKGESTIQNNNRDIFAEVLDFRTKVIIVSDAPHPDLGAIRAALESNLKYDIVERHPTQFDPDRDSAALVIFYQVPSVNGARIPESTISRLPAVLFVLGSQSDLTEFNRLDAGLKLISLRNSFAESFPVVNEAFSYFTTDQSFNQLNRRFPPLQSPFGEFQYAVQTETFAFQRISGTTTSFPMICFTQMADQKRGFITGENFWRWRISNYMQTLDHQAFDQLFQKIVQYLSVKYDRNLFKVRMKSTFLENEPVEAEAELLNRSNELINEYDASVVITDDEGNNYPFSFGRIGRAYFLRTGSFPPGVYNYRAEVTAGPDKYQRSGSFVVTPVDLEAINLKADHNILYRIAEIQGGEMVYPGNIQSLPDIIEANEEIHSISRTKEIFSELIDAWWVFFLILGFITAEWALRKYSGI